MGRRRGQGPQQHVKGFRPGKEPPELRKAHAKKQFGDMNAAQERMVELFSERSPEQSRKLISRWKTGAFVAGVVLSILTVLAWMWTWIAGTIVGVLAGVVFFVYFRLRAQTAQLEQMADTVAQVTNRKR
ncbi:MAG: hypothetical protein WEA34_05505 [Gemmatimonadota bacterium]